MTWIRSEATVGSMTETRATLLALTLSTCGGSAGTGSTGDTSGGPAIAAQPQIAKNTAPTALDRIFQRLGAEFVKDGKADGLSVAVIQDGRVSFYNFGTISRYNPQVPTEHTVYEIGSITKVITGLILGQAVVEGKANLQDDIRRYLPGEYPKLVSDGEPVRLIHLVNTTSALPDNLPDPFALFAEADPQKIPFLVVEALDRYTDEAFLTDLGSSSLVGKPGETPRHSNVAANLLGYILGKVYDAPYGTLVARYVEQPYGMHSGIDLSRAPIAATGYGKGDGAMPLLSARSILASGGLRYSTADMARFLSAQLAGTDPAVRLSQQPAWGSIDKMAIGFNWRISKTVDGKRRLQHTGGTFGFSSYIEMYPELHYGIVLLVNRAGAAQDQLQVLAEAALEELRDGPPALKALEDALASSGFRNVGRTVTNVRRQHPALHLTEDYVNRWGYRLMGEAKPQLAVGLFEFNAEQWPESGNAFDSLAEAYEQVGDVKRATSSYRRSLELDPSNKNAAEQLQKLGQR